MKSAIRVLLAILASALIGLSARADDWPQWMGQKRDNVWRETGLLEKFPEGGPKVLWRVPVEGGYAGPAVAGGKVYVLDFVHPANQKIDPNKRDDVKGTERVLCFDAATGKQVWKFEYPCTYKIGYAFGPRCTPTVQGGKVYALGAMGNLTCLDTGGKEIWSKDFQKDYGAKIPLWGIASHPLVDGNKLFCVVGGEGSVAVAFDKDTGKELWKALSAKEQGYCPPTMIEAGGVKQLLIFDAENLSSLNPETGKVYWSVPIATQFGMAIAAPVKTGDYLFAAGNGTKSVMLKLASDKPAATEVWRGKSKTSLYPINVTPFAEGDYIYGVDQPGQLRCFKVETGERLWETSKPTSGDKPVGTASAFLVKNGDRFVIMSDTGDLIFAHLSPKSYDEISRAHILEPTNKAFGREVVWSPPAFAHRCMFARNDKELVCVSLAADQGKK